MVLCSGCKKSYPNRYAWKYQNLHWKWKANAQQFIESYKEVILEETCNIRRNLISFPSIVQTLKQKNGSEISMKKGRKNSTTA